MIRISKPPFPWSILTSKLTLSKGSDQTWCYYLLWVTSIKTYQIPFPSGFKVVKYS